MAVREESRVDAEQPKTHSSSSHHYECASAQNLHWCKANLHGPWPTLVVSHDCDPSNESYLYHFCGPFCICPGRLIKQSNTHILVIFTRVCCFALLIRVWGWLETRLQVALGYCLELLFFAMSPIFIMDTYSFFPLFPDRVQLHLFDILQIPPKHLRRNLKETALSLYPRLFPTYFCGWKRTVF